MKHQVFGRKFNRDIKERKALFKNLISSLILSGRIETTEEKAKAVKGEIDKLVGQAKEGTLAARRQLQSVLSPAIVDKLVREVSPHFIKRSSGFTQIFRLGPRRGDNASMVLLQWVEKITPLKKEKPIKEVRKPKELKALPKPRKLKNDQIN